MWLVVLVVCGSLLAVPVVAILALQIGTNRFVRETEDTLLKQAAIYANAYAVAFEAAQELSENSEVPGYILAPLQEVFWNARARTFRPLLNMRQDEILPPLPAPVPTDAQRDPRQVRIAPDLDTLARRASRTTLSAVLFLDAQGLNLLTPQPMSYAMVPEVQKALRGEIGAVLRWRSDAEQRISLTSFSRGSGFRVLVAYPVISSNHVIGAVYVSRTPPGLDKYLSEESTALTLLIAVTLLAAVIMGTILVRTVLRPVRALRDQSRRLAQGSHKDLSPLDHYGMREIAELGEAVTTMADSLARRSKEIGIYTNHVTHELKSPVTTIIGAAELLEDGGLTDTAQRELFGTITTQGRRMERLLGQLREMMRSRQHMPGGPAPLADMLPGAPGIEIKLTDPHAILPLSIPHGETVLAHLVHNAIQHGATALEIGWDGRTLTVSDNGEGFAAVTLDRLGEPFFTTRRDSGGTGLGLAIVTAILELYGARLTPVQAPAGAVFEIAF